MQDKLAPVQSTLSSFLTHLEFHMAKESSNFDKWYKVGITRIMDICGPTSIMTVQQLQVRMGREASLET